MTTQITITCQRCRRVDSREGVSLTATLMRIKILGLAGWAVRGDGPKMIDLCPKCAREAHPRIYHGKVSDQ